MSPKMPTFGLMAEFLIRTRGHVVLSYSVEMQRGTATRSLWAQEQPTHVGTFTILEETDMEDWNQQKRALLNEFGLLAFVSTRPTFLYRAGKI